MEDQIMLPYRKDLAKLVCAIERENNLEETDTVLLLHLLDSKEKAELFKEWVRSKMQSGHLEAKNSEITRAAVKISKGMEP